MGGVIGYDATPQEMTPTIPFTCNFIRSAMLGDSVIASGSSHSAGVVGAGYALSGVLAASGLLYEKSRLGTVFTGQVALQRKAWGPWGVPERAQRCRGIKIRITGSGAARCGSARSRCQHLNQ